LGAASQNIRRDRWADRIIVVCPNKDRREEIRGVVEGAGLQGC
jgi:hypothetical protein